MKQLIGENIPIIFVYNYIFAENFGICQHPKVIVYNLLGIYQIPDTILRSRFVENFKVWLK